MNNKAIKHGVNLLWDMEIDSYKEVFLHDLFEDTVVHFEYLHCDEMYIGLNSLRRNGDSTWRITVPVKCIDNAYTLNTACKELSKHCDFLVSYLISTSRNDDHSITVLIDKDMSIYDAFFYGIEKRDIVIDYVSSLENKGISKISHQTILDMLPVYSRAAKKVELELSNFQTDDIANSKKIIDICSRVKSVDSIREKIHRKGICQFDIFNCFDDIAGVRCTCEFLGDVYDVLDYIKSNPLFEVLSVENKIEEPTKAGYRGIHVIVSTSIFYHGIVYENIKVEIQLRTAFQNAWSMKTHQLTYKRESEISEEIANTLKMMSDALKEADDAAQQIRDTLRKGGEIK